MKLEEKRSDRKVDCMIKFRQKGSFKNTEAFFEKIGEGDYLKGLEYYGEAGVSELMKATPKDTGLTAASWSYSIDKKDGKIVISWNNSNIQDGVNIAAIIQYGHAMPSGYYVEGVDYINPALKPLFDLIGKRVWEEVTSGAKHR